MLERLGASRRTFLTLAAGAMAAPIVVRAGELMPVKAPIIASEIERVRVWPALNYLCASYNPDGPNILIAGYSLPRHYKIADILVDDKPLVQTDGASWRIDRRPGDLYELRITVPDGFGPTPVVSATIIRNIPPCDLQHKPAGTSAGIAA
jgi:hypothetical protein